MRCRDQSSEVQGQDSAAAFDARTPTLTGYELIAGKAGIRYDLPGSQYPCLVAAED